jgi:hypothetical protein
MKNKLTTLEKRAAAFCALAQEQPVTLQIEWRKNYEGMQAVALDYRGDVMARTSGGGYCKLSAALADVCRHLSPVPAWRGGHGVNAMRQALAAVGWELAHIVDTKKLDVFTLAKASPVFSVIVGNIGTVYDGADEKTARETFAEYCDQSRSSYGRAAGEDVTLCYDGETVAEFFGEGGEA